MDNTKETLSGYIKAIIPNRGYGFITSDAGVDYFFHAVGVIEPAFDQLREGQPVDFLSTDGQKGPKAIGVTLK